MGASFKEKQEEVQRQAKLDLLGSSSQPGIPQLGDDDAIAKQKPFNEPRSLEFFATLKENDVLKCLGMLKSNPNLA